MNGKKLYLAGLTSFIVLMFNVQLVLAHETITVGDYEIEVGWSTEPPIVGEKNAVVVNISDTSGGGEQPVEDVSSLTVIISYGGQNKVLALQPLGEDTPGQFVAPILPTVPGEYEVIFSGSLGDTAVDAKTHVEEVQTPETLAFPSVASAQSTGAGADWLVWLSIFIGLIAIGLGVTALRKTSTR